MAAFRRRGRTHSVLSHEFVIQNRADIAAAAVVLVLAGLMFEVTAKTAFMFISPQYNVSTTTADGDVVYYLYGTSDFVTISFYIFITIILHAVVQEYALDKLNKRLHLSKVKHSKVNESGQLVVLHLVSSVWGLFIIASEGYASSPSSLWEGYPHSHLSFQMKFFYLCQISYWVHMLPELYFQRVRKEEIPRQLLYIALYLLHITGAYLLKGRQQEGNYRPISLMSVVGKMLELIAKDEVTKYSLTRLGLVLLLLQSVAELVFHSGRLLYFTDENNQRLFHLWAMVFVFTRLMTLTLAVLVIGFGLSGVEHQTLDVEKGIYNTLPIRLAVLLMICAPQAWMMWRFINFQLRRWRQGQEERGSRRRVGAVQGPRTRSLRRDPGHHENGLIKPDNGASPRPRKVRSP